MRGTQLENEDRGLRARVCPNLDQRPAIERRRGAPRQLLSLYLQTTRYFQNLSVAGFVPSSAANASATRSRASAPPASAMPLASPRTRPAIFHARVATRADRLCL